MHDPPKAPIKRIGDPKPKPEKPAIRLDDLIPNEKVLGGRRVIFGVRANPLRPSQP